MVETFPHVIDLSQSKLVIVSEIGLRTLVTRFGQGKEQRRSVGISRKTYTKRFTKEETDGTDVWDFYQARKGAYESFILQIKNRSGLIENKTVRFLDDNLTQEIVFGILYITGITFVDVL